MANLPIELISLILISFRPTFSPIESWSKRPSISSQRRPHSFKQYSQSLAMCAQLRLVNHSFHDILTPHLYSLLIIPAKSQLQQHRCHAADYHPELVQTILFNGILDPYTATDRQIEVVSYLKKVLRRCINLTHIRVDMVGHPAWYIDTRMTKSLFQDLPTKSLRSLEIWNPGSDIFAGSVEGLGRETNAGLRELVLHAVSANTILRPVREAGNFENLEKVHIALTPFSANHEVLLAFMTRILDVELTDSSHSDPVVQATQTYSLPITTSRSPHSHSQLRELTISEAQLAPNMDLNLSLLRRLLTIRSIHRSLTTLQLRLRPSPPVREISLPHFDALPSSILELCPLVTRFHFLTWCPVPFLFNIPERITELGVRIAEHSSFSTILPSPYQGLVQIQANLDFPSTTLHTLEPLIEVVCAPEYRRGLKRLCIEWGSKNRRVDVEGQLGAACEEAGIEFHNCVDW